MMKKSLLWMLVFSLLIFSLNVSIAGSERPTKVGVMFVDSGTTYLVDPTKGAGTSVTFDVNVTDVYDLYGYGIKIKWAGRILDVTSATTGPFLAQGGSTFPTIKIFNGPDTAGFSDYMLVADTLLYPATKGVNGNGTLFTITFLVEATGESAFYIFESTLYDSQEGDISHDLEDGYFANETWASKGYPGDVNGDHACNLADLMIVARAMGTDPSYPSGTGWHEWNPDADLNSDLRVDVFDLVIVGVNYGEPRYS